MLTSLQIKNFKGWKDTGKVRLAPLTVIFGANSAGKSSLGHLLLALKQTAQSTDRKRALQLGDANSLIDLGSFLDCLHGHDKKNKLSFTVTWEPSSPMEIVDPTKKNASAKGEMLTLEVVIAAGKADQPEVGSITYRLGSAVKETLNVTFSRDANGKLQLHSDQYQFVHSVGRKWPLDEAEKFYRISETSRARYQNADFLADLALETEKMLEALRYLGPLREYPRHTYSWSGESPEDVAPKGDKTIPAILAAEAEGRKLNRGAKCRYLPFPAFIAERLVDLGVIHSFRVKPIGEGRKDYEVLIKTGAGKLASEVKLTDVGIGVSQVLPAVVLPFYVPRNSTVWMEQPEIHLHPQVQAELADVFITATKSQENGSPRNVQLIIESHSEHFLNRLQRRVADGTIAPEDVAVHFCRSSPSGNELEPLRLNMFGDIENWPENFFGDEMADLTARTVAAMEKRKKLATP
jgi:predicted ATPase